LFEAAKEENYFIGINIISKENYKLHIFCHLHQQQQAGKQT
jgi:hypothetical protein